MNSKVLITISTLAALVMSCRSFEIVPLVSIKFDNPLIKVDSCGNMEISDSGKVWYPFCFDNGYTEKYDTTYAESGETFLIPKHGILIEAYEAYIAQDWNRTLNERRNIQDFTTYYDDYESKYYVKVLYPALKKINLRRHNFFTVSNFQTMELFHNELPDTLISDIAKQYQDDSLFIIETKNLYDYIIIPDCYWNMEDVIDYIPIHLYDDSLEIKDSGHKYFGETVYVPADMNVVKDWQTVYIKDENDPTVYTAYLRRRGYKKTAGYLYSPDNRLTE